MVAITAGRIFAVEAKRDKMDAPVQGMTMNINIDEVDAEKEEITVQYTLAVQYHENVGKMKITGFVKLRDEAKKVKEVHKEWKEKKKLPDGLTEILLNAINYTCAVNGTFFSQPLGLNAPLTLMPVKVGPKPQAASPVPKGEKAA